jgi:hypothetical protein
MTYSDDESRHKDNLQEKPVTNRRRAIVWILVAVGSLAVGLIGGTVVFAWKREWTWVFPAAAFAAYLLAFRRGMLLWNTVVDRTWQRYLWLEPEMVGQDEEFSRVAEDPERTLKIVRPETPRHPAA